MFVLPKKPTDGKKLQSEASRRRLVAASLGPGHYDPHVPTGYEITEASRPSSVFRPNSSGRLQRFRNGLPVRWTPTAPPRQVSCVEDTISRMTGGPSGGNSTATRVSADVCLRPDTTWTLKSDARVWSKNGSRAHAVGYAWAGGSSERASPGTRRSARLLPADRYACRQLKKPFR
jgi:hypothetical protein|eukprot:SAG25_NODE_111_length_14954_cov_8.187950_3_plen_175_part_00